MARRTGKSSSEKAAVNVDLSKVEAGGKTLAEGKYPVKVNSCTLEKSDKSGAKYLKFEFEVTDGKSSGSKLYHNCSLQPQALFNLKSVLLALGFDIPKKSFDLDLKSLIDAECTVEVSHELYEGKKKARITEFINQEDEGEDSDLEISEMLEELDLAELKELAKELKIKEAKLKKAKTEEALIELILEKDEDEVEEAYNELFGEDEEEDDEDEEDDDEDEDDEDYEDMSLADLKAECKDRGLKVKKGASKSDLIEMLEEDDEE